MYCALPLFVVCVLLPIMQVEEFLSQLGFTHVNGNQWKHEVYGYIHLFRYDIKEVAKQLFENGLRFGKDGKRFL